jgi:PAS domain S-box-containing protein
MLKGQADRYRSVFDHCAVSLWEEDISELRTMVHDWQDQGIRDLRTYLGSHPDILGKAIRAIRVIDVNEKALELYETQDKRKLLGPLEVVLTAETIPGVMEYVIAVAEGRAEFETDTAAMSFKGRRLDLFAKIFIPAEGDEYPYALVSILDISERKRLERKLEEERALLRSVIDAIPDAVFLKDRESRFILANQAVADFMNAHSPSELIGKTDKDFYPEDLAREFRFEEEDLMKNGRSLVNKEEQKLIAGATQWVAVTKLAVRDAEGKITGLVGTGRDFTERKRFEEALRESEEEYRTIFMEAPIGIFHSTPEGKLLSANPAFARMLGYESPEKIIEAVNRKNIAEVLYADAQDRSGLINDIVTGAGWHKVEIRFRHRNGATVVARSTVRSYVPRGAAGRELEGFVEDITEQRRAEEARAWEHSLFLMLMEHVPDHVYFKDQASRFLRISKSLSRTLGLQNPSEALGKTDADFFSADYALKAREDEQEIMKTQRPLLDFEERETHEGQSDSWVITSKMPLLNSTGVIVGTFGISHDITQRKELEAKNQELATLVNSASDAIIGTDLGRRVAVWNKGAERIYGYSAEEMIGTTLSRLIPPESEEETRIARDRVIRGEQITNLETTRLRKDGSRVTIDMSLSAIRDTEGKVVGIASTARDITEQKALQEQLNRARRLEGLATLAGGIAHQFNNINTVVGGYLELMRSVAGLPPQVVPYVEAAIVGVQKAVYITDRLLVLTESGGARSKAVRLDELAKTLISLNEKRIKEEKIQLTLDLDDTIPVQGEESRLKFALSSIIANALDSLLDQPERKLRVRTGSTKDSVFFEIEDSGCGIPEEDLHRIFSPFSTMKGEWAPPGSPQAKLKGVGLSLAISNMMVTEYSGRIEVQSTKGVGSTFRVVIPFLR